MSFCLCLCNRSHNDQTDKKRMCVLLLSHFKHSLLAVLLSYLFASFIHKLNGIISLKFLRPYKYVEGVLFFRNSVTSALVKLARIKQQGGFHHISKSYQLSTNKIKCPFCLICQSAKQFRVPHLTNWADVSKMRPYAIFSFISHVKFGHMVDSK